MTATSPPTTATAAFRFDNSFARDLPGFYEPWPPAVVTDRYYVGPFLVGPLELKREFDPLV
jgi:hypothetical protein